MLTAKGYIIGEIEREASKIEIEIMMDGGEFGIELTAETGVIVEVELEDVTYTLLPKTMRRRHGYKVVRVSQTARATEIQLAPEGRPMRPQAGRFALLRLPQSRGVETRPFTISSAPWTVCEPRV